MSIHRHYKVLAIVYIVCYNLSGSEISPLPDSPDSRGSKANGQERRTEGGLHMKDILKAIRTFLRKIQLTITFKTPLIDFSFALLLM